MPLYKLPVVGPWISRVGQVVDIVSLPCNPDPIMWVEGFFTSVPYLIWSLFKPDPIDQTWERFGFPGAGHRHARFRMGGALEGIKIPIPRSARTAALFRLGSLAQRIGWWFCIVDAGTKFAVNWATATYAYAGCIDPEGAASWGLADSEWPVSPGESGILPFSTLRDPAHRFSFDSIIFRKGSPSGYRIVPQVSEWSEVGPPCATVTFEVVNTGTGETIELAPAMTPKPGETLNTYFRRSNYGRVFPDSPYSVGLKYTVSGVGWANLEGSSFSADNSVGNNLLVDPL